MKVFGHIGFDGKIQSVVASADGKDDFGLRPMLGATVCEILGHGLTAKTIDSQKLTQLVESHSVQVTPHKGRLVLAKKGKRKRAA